ncbi:MAG: hypothetical protein CVU05_03740 [Bacteroidetes bacterium HGW-Bacteroidetes-21]|jgi:hypothetical protein|nr:MAG: hypothetical protein CVU05_03740 [Bacteroidetes bacterium HGW-Bacteroidetes-21]
MLKLSNIFLAFSCILMSCGLYSQSYVVNCPIDFEHIKYWTETSFCEDNFPWVLVFEDEFNQTSLDTSKWNTRYGWKNTDTNDSLLYYTNGENYLFNGNYLRLVTKRERILGQYDWHSPDAIITTIENGKTVSIPNERYFHFTTGMLVSKKTFDRGKYEISVRLPKETTKGWYFHPSFWTYGSPWSEIDMFEYKDGPNKPSMNCHYDNGSGGSNNCSSNFTDHDFDENAFQTWSVVWDKYSLMWYYNGKLKRQTNRLVDLTSGTAMPIFCNDLINRVIYGAQVSSFPKSPGSIIINLGLQKDNKDNIPFGPDDADLPGYMDINYVRYYVRMDCDVILNLTGTSTFFKVGLDKFNVVTGQIINLSSMVIPSDAVLKVFASDEVNLLEGFEIEYGSEVEISITDPCSAMDHSEFDNFPSPNGNENQNDSILLYPNPASKLLNVRFDNFEQERFFFYVISMEGKMLFSQKVIEPETKIDIGPLFKGEILFIIIDSKTKNIYKYPVISE